MNYLKGFDWCSSGVAACPAQTVCANEEYLFRCSCADGYSKTGTADGAAHIDECIKNEELTGWWLLLFSIPILLLLLGVPAALWCWFKGKKNKSFKMQPLTGRSTERYICCENTYVIVDRRGSVGASKVCLKDEPAKDLDI